MDGTPNNPPHVPAAAAAFLRPSFGFGIMNTPVVMPKRKRISRPKVRSGCVTCKKRHVKCDERKPGCFRCEKAEVSCGGYQPPESSESKKNKVRTEAPIRAILPRPPPMPALQPAPPPALRLQQPVLVNEHRRYPQEQDEGHLHHQQYFPDPISSTTGMTGAHFLSPAISPAISPAGSPAGSVSPSPSPSPAVSPLAIKAPPYPYTIPPTLSIYRELFEDADITYFDLFRTRLVRDLSGFTFSGFWSRTVLRESLRDECVRSAVLAIGALAKALYFMPDDQAVLNDDPGAPQSFYLKTIDWVRNDHHKTALSHYMNAVSMFRERICAAQQQQAQPQTRVQGSNTATAAAMAPPTVVAAGSPRSVLIATILFVTYELLQGNDDTADSLITSGMNLLRDNIRLLDGSAFGGSSSSSSTRGDSPSSRSSSPAAIISRETTPRLLIPVAGTQQGSRSGNLLRRSSSAFSHHGGNNTNSDEDDDMDEIEHLLPRLSVVSGWTGFFPKQQDDCITLLTSTPDSDFPVLGVHSVEQLLPMWNDFCTRCLLWVKRLVSLNMRGVAFDADAACAEQDDFRALLRRWRGRLREYIAAVAAERRTAEGLGSSHGNDAAAVRGDRERDRDRDRGNRRMGGTGMIDGWHEKMRTLLVLELHNVFCDTYVAGCVDGTTLTYDTLGGSFAEILALARGVLAFQDSIVASGATGINLNLNRAVPPTSGMPYVGPPTSSTSGSCSSSNKISSIDFTFDVGLILPVGFVVAHCRDRGLRAQAMELYSRLGGWREGAHDARAQAMGHAALARLEEAGRINSSGGNVSNDSNDSSMMGRRIPPESRYAWTLGRWDLDRRKLFVQFTCVVPDRRTGRNAVREMWLNF